MSTQISDMAITATLPVGSYAPIIVTNTSTGLSPQINYRFDMGAAFSLRPTSAMLAANGGAALIGTSDSITVQAALGARPTSAALAASGGASLVGFIQAGSGATERPAQDKLREVISVNDFGATAGSGDADEDTEAIRAAIARAVALGGAVIEAGPYRYLIDDTILIDGNVQSITIRGSSKGGTVFESTIVGAAAEPMIKLTSTALFFTLEDIELQGNSLTGASGNGHALACISPSGLAPQNVSLHNVAIRGFKGTGKDHAGNSIPACGWYGYQSTSFFGFDVVITNCAMAVRWKAIEDSSFHGHLFDACDRNCLYLEGCHAITFHGGTMQDSGGVDGVVAGDSIVYLDGNDSIAWFGGEMKNGKPYLLDAGGTNISNTNITLNGVYLAQLDSVNKGSTAIRVGNGCSSFSVQDCEFEFVNTMTTAVGIEIVQNFTGVTMAGLAIRGSTFVIGTGGTISKGIYFNSLTNRCDAPIIEGNVFGNSNAGASTTTITDAIKIVGDVRSPRIQSNTSLAGRPSLEA
jgi:hypothetical protein